MPNPRTLKSAPGGAWGSAGPRWGAREGAWGGASESARESAWEGARDLFLVPREGGRALSRAPSQAPPHAPSQAPHLGPALPQAPPGALFRVRGFGTSVAGQATRNPRIHMRLHRCQQLTCWGEALQFSLCWSCFQCCKFCSELASLGSG